ncbi:16S rRNA (cytosine(1402)-N(4))-methyltransferase [hydrothermal vent metagenome]|uniref:16S rRNA (Cytosine(1402)-N(4))-methyltransferase n=1 Tax=hydrothermal vent metagenome TaxID=652676 RepID=A0A3B0V1Z3_9ZZZZ
MAHCPVLLAETMELLDPVPGGVYVDGNLGMGGHSREILRRSAPDGRLIGFDLDADAIAMARRNLTEFGGRVEYIQDNFANSPKRLADLGIDAIDGLLLDLGLSSYQLDSSARGFSFQGKEPLDMRMDKGQDLTAAQILNSASSEELADIFYFYGEERQARRIASFVVQERRKQKIITTDQLVALVARAVPRKFQPRKIHVATKVFQALRIAVNKEMDNLLRILKLGPQMLKNEAKFCVISFHSLEDRLIKRAFQSNPSLSVVTRKPVIAGEDELRLNPRARSAKLRMAKKEVL